MDRLRKPCGRADHGANLYHAGYDAPAKQSADKVIYVVDFFYARENSPQMNADKQDFKDLIMRDLIWN